LKNSVGFRPDSFTNKLNQFKIVTYPLKVYEITCARSRATGSTGQDGGDKKVYYSSVIQQTLKTVQHDLVTFMEERKIPLRRDFCF
jgi:protein associated with RNAse G/E